VIVARDDLDYPRSAYYHAMPPESDDVVIRAVIQEVVDELSRFGYRRVGTELRHDLLVMSQASATLDVVDRLQRKIKAKSDGR
jgi:hypothetical protein